MLKHIYIFGAPGSGCTTLGVGLAKTLGYTFFDKDDYFADKGKLRDSLQRDSLLDRDLRITPAWVLAGDISEWGDFLIKHFDLVIFLHVPRDIRMNRIKKRERTVWENAGLSITNNEKYETFIKWTEKYDTDQSCSISFARHKEWLARLSCPVLTLEGGYSAKKNIRKILEKFFNNPR